MNRITRALLFPFIWWICLFIISFPFTAGMSWVMLLTFDYQDWMTTFRVFAVSYPFLFVCFLLLPINDIHKVNDDEQLFISIMNMEEIHLSERYNAQT